MVGSSAGGAFELPLVVPLASGGAPRMLQPILHILSLVERTRFTSPLSERNRKLPEWVVNQIIM